MQEEETQDLPQTFEFWKARADELSEALQETRDNLDEFQASSKELEDELERELASLDLKVSESRNREAQLLEDVREWKAKYHQALSNSSAQQSQMLKELEMLRSASKEARGKLRDVELENDDLEREGRMIETTLSDLQSRYNSSLERMTLLEEELATKANLEEGVQRLKDELRDMATELAVNKDMTPKLRELEEEKEMRRDTITHLQLQVEKLTEQLLSSTPVGSRGSADTFTPVRYDSGTLKLEDITPNKVIVAQTAQSSTPLRKIQESPDVNSPLPTSTVKLVDKVSMMRSSGLTRSTTSPSLGTPSRLPRPVATDSPASPTPVNSGLFRTSTNNGSNKTLASLASSSSRKFISTPNGRKIPMSTATSKATQIMQQMREKMKTMDSKLTTRFPRGMSIAAGLASSVSTRNLDKSYQAKFVQVNGNPKLPTSKVQPLAQASVDQSPAGSDGSGWIFLDESGTPVRDNGVVVIDKPYKTPNRALSPLSPRFQQSAFSQQPVIERVQRPNFGPRRQSQDNSRPSSRNSAIPQSRNARVASDEAKITFPVSSTTISPQIADRPERPVSSLGTRSSFRPISETSGRPNLRTSLVRKNSVNGSSSTSLSSSASHADIPRSVAAQFRKSSTISSKPLPDIPSTPPSVELQAKQSIIIPQRKV